MHWRDGNGHFILGKNISTGLSEYAALKPEEAWNIDTKLDDGMPGSGKVVTRYWNNACATATSNTDYTSPYKVASGTVACTLYFRQQF